MVMVTTAPLVCNKTMFTQALNVSGDPASRPSRSPPGHACHCAENTGLCVLGRLLSVLPGFPVCPLAWGRGPGAQGTYLPSAALSGLQDPVWLWAFVDRGQRGAGGGIRGEDVCSSAAQCHSLKSHYLRIFGQSGPDICLANPFF